MNKRILLAIYSPANNLRAGKHDVAGVHSVMRDVDIGACDRELSDFYECTSKVDFISKLSTVLNEWDPQNQFIFYFTGHGEIKNDNYYFVFENKSGEKTYYNEKAFFSELETYNVIKSIIIIDSCHSGKLTERPKGSDRASLQIDADTLPDGFLILTSSSGKQVSSETIDGSGSIFTDIFIEALNTGLGGGRTRDDYIYANELVEYVKSRLDNDKKYSEYRQKPRFSIYKASTGIWIAKNKSRTLEIENKPGIQVSASIQDVIEHGKNISDIERPCENSDISGINLELLKRYFDNQESIHKEVSWDLNNIETILFKLNLLYTYKINGYFKPRKSTVLCFYRAPHRYYNCMTSKFIVFSLDESYAEKIIDIQGSIPEQIDKIYQLIKDYTNYPAFHDGANFIKEVFSDKDYQTVREIISNAFAHRDYVSDRPITIRIYNDRIEIQNPGLFSKIYDWNYYLKLGKPISNPINSFIPQYLSSFNKYEGIGQGFNKIRSFLEKYGKKSIVCIEETSGPYTIIEIRNPNQELYKKNKIIHTVVNAKVDGDGNVIIGSDISHTIFNLKEAAQYKIIESEVERLKIRLERMQSRIEKYPDDEELKNELTEIQNEWESRQKDLETLKQEILKLARDFQRIPTNTKRLRWAKQHFEKGELDKARSVLDADAISDELDILFEPNNILDNRAESLRNISDEFLILARLTATDFNLQDRYDRTIKYFNQSLKAERNRENLFAFAYFLQEHNQFEQAQLLYEEALQTIKKLADVNPQTYLPDVATTLNNLANIYKERNEFNQAEPLYKEALETIKKLAEANPQTYLPDLAGTLNNLANLYQARNEFSRAQPLYEEALETIKKLTEVNPQTYLPDLSVTLNNLANLFQARNEFSQAQSLYEEALQTIKKLVEVNPQTYLPDLSVTLNNLANLFQARNEFSQAQPLYEEALQTIKKLAEANPQTYLPDLAITSNNLANLFQARNEFSQAQPLYEEALLVYRKLVSTDQRTTYLSDLGTTLNNLANLFQAKKDFSKAQPLYEEALLIYRKLVSIDQQEAYLSFLATILNNLGNLYKIIKEYYFAYQMFNEALSICKQLDHLNPEIYLSKRATTLNNLANIQYLTQDFENALTLYEESIYIYHKLSEDNPEPYLSDYSSALKNYSSLLNENKLYVEALEANTKALKIYQGLSEEIQLSNYLVEIGDLLTNIAIIYSKLKEFDKAQDNYTEAIETYKKNPISAIEYLEQIPKSYLNASVFYQKQITNRSLSVKYAENAIKYIIPFFDQNLISQKKYLKDSFDILKHWKYEPNNILEEMRGKLNLSEIGLYNNERVITVLILTPLQLEYNAVIKHLTGERESFFLDGAIYEQGLFAGKHHHYKVVIREPGMRNVDMALATEKSIRQFQPQIVLLIGVTGGIKDVRIGDVLVPQRVYGYESGKDDSDGFRSRPVIESLSKELLSYSQVLSRQDNWKKRCYDGAQDAKVFFGSVATGDKVLVYSDNPAMKRIITHYNDAIGIDMEAFGFTQAIQSHRGLYGLVIRGISDLLKGKSETDIRNSQIIAAERASAFGFELLYELNASNFIAANLGVMDLKTLVKEIYSLLFPAGLKEINHDFTDAINGDIRELWKRVKPLFIEEVIELSKSPDDIDAQADVRNKLRKELDGKLDIQRELITLLEKAKTERYNSVSTISVVNSKNIVSGSINIGGNFQLGDG